MVAALQRLKVSVNHTRVLVKGAGKQVTMITKHYHYLILKNSLSEYFMVSYKHTNDQYSSEKIASYCYSKSSKELVTYDNVDIALRKAEYIKQNGLGGGMYWELSGDNPEVPKSIVINVALNFTRLDGVNNHIEYPQSRFDNVRNGM